MNDFVNVPVPGHLVVDVMKFIATFDQETEDPVDVESVRSDLDPNGTDKPSWSRSELEIIHQHRGSMPSVELFAQVLSHLASIAPESTHRDDIAEKLGIDGLTMVKKFGAVTRFINNRIPSRNNQWPMVWGDRKWGMEADTAKLWESVVAS